LVGEDAGEADVESVVKPEEEVISEAVKKTNSTLSDSDKLKRPKRKRKKYVNRPDQFIVILTVVLFVCKLNA